MHIPTRAVALTLAIALGGGGIAYAALTKVAGPKTDRTAITPVGYAVTPAGRQTTLGNLPLNAALHPDGRTLLVTNNGQGVQSLQLVDTQTNRVTQTISYPSPESLYVGLAWSPDGKTAYASAAANSKIRIFSFADGKLTEGAPLPLPTTSPDGTKVTLFPAGLAVTADGSRLIVADQLGNAVTSVDLATKATQTVAAGHRPVWVTLAKDGHTAYVSNQGGSTVDVVDVSDPAPVVTGHITVGLHPNKSVLSSDGRTLYVSNGDADTISVIQLASSASPMTTRTISLQPYKDAPVGSNPTGLALDDVGKQLYVTNSGNNDVAVIDLTKGAVTGLIPTAWYPSSVSWHEGRLIVTNAKGLGAGPNNGPGQPSPQDPGPKDPQKYSGSMIEGTLSVLDAPSADELSRYTTTVKKNNDPVKAGASVVPTRPGASSPIKHVIYVVKENRTYDQVLGSLGKGNGDPGINLFGDESAPNFRELSRRFTTIDNFYADAEVSANGWNWVAQGNEFHAEDPVLDAKTDHGYQGYDLSCPDSSGTFTPLKTTCLEPRVDRWMKSFESYQATGDMPTVQFVRLPSDHTSGTSVGKPTPKAMVADNDYALGRLVDTVSHSTFWKDTAILVTEDDAQNGPDHVDAHRTLALAISPYTQNGRVDSTFYSTASMVRTIGLFAGTGPLTQFDDYSTPMSASFMNKPNPLAYRAIRPTYPMNTVNAATAPMAAISGSQALGKVDQIDEKTFNEAIWKSVRGADSVMPTPRHALMGAGSK